MINILTLTCFENDSQDEAIIAPSGSRRFPYHLCSKVEGGFADFNLDKSVGDGAELVDADIVDMMGQIGSLSNYKVKACMSDGTTPEFNVTSN